MRRNESLRTALELRARLYALIREFFAVTRRAGSGDADPFGRREHRAEHCQLHDTVFRACRFRTARTLAAHFIRIRAEAPARRRYRRQFRTRSGFPRWRGRTTAQPRVHDAGVVPRRLGSPAARSTKPSSSCRRRLRCPAKRAEVHRIAYRDLFHEAIGLDPFAAGNAQLQSALGDVRVDAYGAVARRLAGLVAHAPHPAEFSRRSHHGRIRLSGIAMRARENPRWRFRQSPNASSCTPARRNWRTATTS